MGIADTARIRATLTGRHLRASVCRSFMKSPVSQCRAVAGPAPRPVSLTTSPDGDYFADLGADNLAGDHNLHAAILLPALRGVVRRHRLSLAETLRSDRASRHSLLHQVIAHGRARLF